MCITNKRFNVTRLHKAAATMVKYVSKKDSITADSQLVWKTSGLHKKATIEPLHPALNCVYLAQFVSY